jgi:hypothetical protein
MWRGLSWLARSDAAENDLEDRFISLWIAFNAIYAKAGEEKAAGGDHATWQGFLAEIVKLDTSDILGDLLHRNQVSILRLVQNKYLFRPFWNRQPNADSALKMACTDAVLNLANHLTTGIMEELFERLYVLRAQVFHGAATRGSKLNRTNLRMGVDLLAKLVPAMIAIMLAAGPKVDWGEVCFPPTKD